MGCNTVSFSAWCLYFEGKADFKTDEKPFFETPGNTNATTLRHVPRRSEDLKTFVIDVLRALFA
jgi:hypothetical protein